MENLTVKKRQRSTNFSFLEMERLVDLVIKHKAILECKETDKYSTEDKEVEWGKLSDEFNAHNSDVHRSTAQLQLKFTNMKKDTRKAVANERTRSLATGGGEYKPMPLTNLHERVLGIIQLSAEGLPSKFDSDRAEPQKTPSPVYPDHNGEEIPFATDEGDLDFTVVQVLYDKEMDVEDEEVIHESEAIEKAKKSRPNLWKKYTPAMLRKKLHPALQPDAVASATRKGGIHEAEKPSTHQSRVRKRSDPNLGAESLATLAKAKQELVELQLEILRRDAATKEQRDKQEHKKKIKILNLEAQYIKLKMEGQRLDNELKQAELQRMNFDHANDY